MALGANAAAAIENAILYEEIDRLFEGFVKASVVAIESRDPTTSGHSERVAELTLGLAENLERVTTGPYAGIALLDRRHARDPLRRAAARLRQGRRARARAGQGEQALPRRARGHRDALPRPARAEARTPTCAPPSRRCARAAELPPDYNEALQRELDEHRDVASTFIRECNRPTVLDAGGFERLHEIARSSPTSTRAASARRSSASAELERLSIPRGSLDQSERLEIESHVTHTFRFLSQIPWTRDLRRVPEIAYAHHEKLDGGGYPRQLQAEQIPVQARMMTIADIYDALTASDRPYKKAVPHERALDILEEDAKHDKLDRNLLDVFIEARGSPPPTRGAAVNIQLFNFLEDYNAQIVNLLMGKIPRSIPAYSRMPRTELKQMLEHLLDGYVDLLGHRPDRRRWTRSFATCRACTPPRTSR